MFESLTQSQFIAMGVLALLNIPVYVLVGRLFFPSLQDFLDAVFFWLKPDLWSLFDGSFWDDWIAEMKLGIWAMACLGLVGAEFFLLWPLIENMLPS
jgi:hypothetical protein